MATMVLANFATETSTGVLQVRNKFSSQAIINLVSSVLTASIIVWAFFAKKGLMEVMAGLPGGKIRPWAWARSPWVGAKCKKSLAKAGCELHSASSSF